MSGIDISNLQFQAAFRFVSQTDRHIFLTGKAGTGKTTFLKYIREHCSKQMVIVAPTGVAAINAGGVTLHSFFQIPFGPYIPVTKGHGAGAATVTDQHSLFKNLRFNKSKIELLRELELLVIDEVSMMRADILDAIDSILRHFRKQLFVPFGGVQVLYIGDLFQLPPVTRNEEWGMLNSYYKSPFFFDAKVIEQAFPVCIELKKIYRQKENDFIAILNKIRNNQCESSDLEILHKKYIPDFVPNISENFITLTSHNSRADAINANQLQKLNTSEFVFEAKIEKDFSEKSFPAEKSLQLKVGAQIMFIKNDKGENRRYFNGKIANISRLSEEEIYVIFPGEQEELKLEKESWRNIRYIFNKVTGEIEEEELGRFTQYPIRLAWAITIHKSQGLTFDRAIIDAGNSFAPGQVYVALSRLTSLDGLVLYSKIYPNAIQTDKRVIEFSLREIAVEELEETLKIDQRKYFLSALRKSFEWSKILAEVEEFESEYDGRHISDKFEAIQWFLKLSQSVKSQQEIALKFGRQLEQIIHNAALDRYESLYQRMVSAYDYFKNQLQASSNSILEHIKEYRPKQRVKKYIKELQELELVFERKIQEIERAVQISECLRVGSNPEEILVVKNETSFHENVSYKEKRTSKLKRLAKGETARITLELFLHGKTIEEIASTRSLAAGTVMNHLISFIPTGEIELAQLVERDKIQPILETIQLFEDSKLTPIKEKLGDNFSYNEIKAVMVYHEKIKQGDPA